MIRDGVHVTRFDMGDYGTEIRAEVSLNGATFEVLVAHGINGMQVHFVRYGDDPANPYGDSVALYEGDGR